MMLNPVPAKPATESPWAQLLIGGAAGARGAVADAKGGAAKDEATPVQVEQAVRQANEVLALREVGLRFEVDKETDMVIVKVVDRASGEVIRQIPNEEVVRIAKLMNDGNGLLVDHAA
ncbi:flagellar protein FlaG [Variovorax sp. W6]|uniref:flagellar protein FlaG n=1 Tax=Variovorax sp. W6 TaxID=3093895 RepID=UPI003D809002